MAKFDEVVAEWTQTILDALEERELHADEAWYEPIVLGSYSYTELVEMAERGE